MPGHPDPTLDAPDEAEPFQLVESRGDRAAGDVHELLQGAVAGDGDVPAEGPAGPQ